MARAWPFEDKEEPARRINSPEDFVARRSEGTEAVIIRIGLRDAQLVVVDSDGGWDRWVYGSVEEAEEIARQLGTPVHVGAYPEETRVRMNAHRRPTSDFDRGAYPEQGSVGPVIEYPENRPRRADVLQARDETEASRRSSS
jgi:hypothetical protein